MLPNSPRRGVEGGGAQGQDVRRWISNHIWLFILYRALYKIFTHILYRIVNHLKVKG